MRFVATCPGLPVPLFLSFFFQAVMHKFQTGWIIASQKTLPKWLLWIYRATRNGGEGSFFFPILFLFLRKKGTYKFRLVSLSPPLYPYHPSKKLKKKVVYSVAQHIGESESSIVFTSELFLCPRAPQDTLVFWLFWIFTIIVASLRVQMERRIARRGGECFSLTPPQPTYIEERIGASFPSFLLWRHPHTHRRVMYVAVGALTGRRRRHRPICTGISDIKPVTGKHERKKASKRGFW